MLRQWARDLYCPGRREIETQIFWSFFLCDVRSLYQFLYYYLTDNEIFFPFSLIYWASFSHELFLHFIIWVFVFMHCEFSPPDGNACLEVDFWFVLTQRRFFQRRNLWEEFHVHYVLTLRLILRFSVCLATHHISRCLFMIPRILCPLEKWILIFHHLF